MWAVIIRPIARRRAEGRNKKEINLSNRVNNKILQSLRNNYKIFRKGRIKDPSFIPFFMLWYNEKNKK